MPRPSEGNMGAVFGWKQAIPECSLTDAAQPETRKQVSDHYGDRCCIFVASGCMSHLEPSCHLGEDGQAIQSLHLSKPAGTSEPGAASGEWAPAVPLSTSSPKGPDLGWPIGRGELAAPGPGRSLAASKL